MSKLSPDAYTQQKLNHVRFHLAALDEAFECSDWRRDALISSYRESVLFHLSGAVMALVREVAGYYGVAADDLQTLEQARERVAAEGKASPELNELAVSAESASGWLHAFDAAWQACQRGDLGQLSSREVSAASQIQLVQLAEPELAEAGPEQLRAWYQALQDQVQRFRNSVEEW